MQVNSHNTVGQTNSQKLNPAREARQQIAANPADAESIFGKLVSSLAKGAPETTPTTSG